MGLPPLEVDLYSDTKTRPTPAMRMAMAEAEVGDEQAFEDPTVNALVERIAELLGKEAAVFLPSGTMANEISYRLHCRPGDEIVLDVTGHAIDAEAGGPAALAGAMLNAVPGRHGVFTAEQLEAAIRPKNRHHPRTRCVSVENTSNFGGGTVWPLAVLDAVTATARRHGLATHLDGARLMNAVVASMVPAARICRDFDSCWLDFSKGLGAPVGACLAGSRDLIDEAWRLKQQMGGAMRQAGIIAAAALHALDHHVDRLAEDHANAKRLAEGLAELPGIVIDPDRVETNILFFEIDRPGLSAADFDAGLRRQGVRMGAVGPQQVRAVTHLDVDRAGIDRALIAAAQVLRH
jgi:threonine aldolase